MEIKFRVELMRPPDELRDLPLNMAKDAFEAILRGEVKVDLRNLPVSKKREIAYNDNGAHFYELAEMLGTDNQIHARIQVVVNNVPQDSGIIHFIADAENMYRTDPNANVQLYIAQVVLNKIVEEYNSMTDRLERSYEYMWKLAWEATKDSIIRGRRWLN